MQYRCAIFLLFFWLLLSTASFAKAVDSRDNTQEPIRLGVITLYHPLEMYKQYQPFVDYISATSPYDFELKITQDYVTILKLLCEGDIDIALLGGLTYIEAADHFCGVPFLAALDRQKKPVYQGTFISREQDTKVHTFQDIKGKRFAFASKFSTSGNLAPLYHLYAKSGIKRTDFAEYKNLDYHDSVAREVLRGNFDAGVVLDSVARKYQGKGIHILGRTEPLPGFLFVLRPGLDSQVKASLQDVLLALDYENPEHREIMDRWDSNIRYGFSKTDDKSYDPIRQMLHYLAGRGVFLGGSN